MLAGRRNVAIFTCSCVSTARISRLLCLRCLLARKARFHAVDAQVGEEVSFPRGQALVNVRLRALPVGVRNSNWDRHFR